MATNKVIANGKTLIDLTGDTALEKNVEKGFKFHKADGTQGVGTLVPNSDVDLEVPVITLDNATGLISASANGLTGKKWLITRGKKTFTPTTSDQIIEKYVWLTGDVICKGDAKLVPGNIKKGVSIFGVNGSYDATEGYIPKPATCSFKLQCYSEDFDVTYLTPEGNISSTITVDENNHYVLSDGVMRNGFVSVRSRTGMLSVLGGSGCSAGFFGPSGDEVIMFPNASTAFMELEFD